VLATRVPGSAIWARANRDFAQDGCEHGINHQELARSARSRKGKLLLLCRQHTAGFWAARNRREVAQVLSIDDLDGARRGIGDEDTTTLEGHIAMIEVSLLVKWEIDVLVQKQRVSHRCALSC